MAEGCLDLPLLGDGSLAVWGVTVVEAYKDCRDRLLLAQEAWPK